jgi:hypothetical protein
MYIREARARGKLRPASLAVQLRASARSIAELAGAGAAARLAP